MILRIEDFSQSVALKANNENWAVPPRGELHVTRELEVIAAFPPATVAVSKAASSENHRCPRRKFALNVHCRNEQEGQALKSKLQVRLAGCRLEMHQQKPKPSIAKTRSAKSHIRTPNLKNNAPLI